MLKQMRLLISLAAIVGMIGLPIFAQATAQPEQPRQTPVDSTQDAIAQTRPAPTRSEFEGRGVAHGSVFRRGQNVNVSLTVDQGRFTLNMAQPPGTRTRVRYQGAVSRQNNTANTPNSFTLDGRVQTFDSSASTRIFNNTTGTCRIEVFDARVISSTCRSVAPDSKTDFLGLEQF